MTPEERAEQLRDEVTKLARSHGCASWREYIDVADIADAIAAERKRCLSLARCMAGAPLVNAIESGEELT